MERQNERVDQLAPRTAPIGGCRRPISQSWSDRRGTRRAAHTVAGGGQWPGAPARAAHMDGVGGRLEAAAEGVNFQPRRRCPLRAQHTVVEAVQAGGVAADPEWRATHRPERRHPASRVARPTRRNRHHPSSNDRHPPPWRLSEEALARGLEGGRRAGGGPGSAPKERLIGTAPTRRARPRHHLLARCGHRSNVAGWPLAVPFLVLGGRRGDGAGRPSNPPTSLSRFTQTIHGGCRYGSSPTGQRVWPGARLIGLHQQRGGSRCTRVGTRRGARGGDGATTSERPVSTRPPNSSTREGPRRGRVKRSRGARCQSYVPWCFPPRTSPLWCQCRKKRRSTFEDAMQGPRHVGE